MKILLNLMLILSVMLLIGCGGGGSNTLSSTVNSLKYNGKTSKTELTASNTKYFVELVNTSFSSAFNTVSFTQVSQKSMKNLIANKNIATSESRAGLISGQISVTIEEIGTYNTDITYIYENFSDYQGEVVSGKVVKHLTLDSNKIVTKDNSEYHNFKIKTQSEDIIIDGNISSAITISGIQIIENYILKNNITKEVFKYENFTTNLNSEGQIISYRGKIYNSKYGYVEVSTLIPLSYSKNGTRKVGGEILLDGDTSSTKIRYAYNNRIRVEIDIDIDGIIDLIQVYQSGNYEEEISNAFPIISITFPQSIYTDSDLKRGMVHVYDPDLDEVTTNYEWTINGVVKGNTESLDNTIFKKHDILKLIVTATDDRAGDRKTNIQSKEQVVLNSRPVIVESFTEISLELGESSDIIYTVSDADNDEILVSWVNYLNGRLEEEWINDIDCEIGLNEYDRLHPNHPYDSLSEYEKEDVNNTYCKREIYGTVVTYDFIRNKVYTAEAPGIYLHEMIVGDGEYNRTKILEANISKMDIIENQVNNHDYYSSNRAYNIYIKDFDNNGYKDLIYMKSITKHNAGYSVIRSEDGGLNTVEPFDFQVQVLVIEYRNGSTISKTEYEINNFELDNFYVNDLNGDGKLDILITHTNGYSPPTNSRFSVRLQDEQGTLASEADINLALYKALDIADITGDGSDDIILSTTDGFNDLGIQIFHEDGNQTIPMSLPNILGHYVVERKMLVDDLDENNKKDIIVVNKNFRNNNQLSFTCSVSSQQSDGSFREKIYEKTLATNLEEYDKISDVIISDFGGLKNIFIVTTTKYIYLLRLDNDLVHIVNKIDYIKVKSKSSTKVLDPVDINHDGVKDLIVLDTSLYADVFIGIFIQKDNLDFFIEQNYSFSQGYSLFNNPSYVLDDLNDDGKYEMFFSTGEDELSAIYFK